MLTLHKFERRKFGLLSVLLSVVCSVVCGMWSVVCCLLSVVCSVCCMLSVVCGLWSVVCVCDFVVCFRKILVKCWNVTSACNFMWLDVNRMWIYVKAIIRKRYFGLNNRLKPIILNKPNLTLRNRSLVVNLIKTPTTDSFKKLLHVHCKVIL